MASVIEIVNDALHELGQDPIISLDAAKVSAQAMKQTYERSRDWLLEQHPWTFAKSRISLARLEDVPLFGFSYAYALPPDFLSFWEEENPDMAFRKEGTALLTDEELVQIIYLRRVTNPNDMTESFRYALSMLLAAKNARRITGDDSRRERAETMFQSALRSARWHNARNSGREEPSRPDLFMRARARGAS